MSHSFFKEYIEGLGCEQIPYMIRQALWQIFNAEYCPTTSAEKHVFTLTAEKSVIKIQHTASPHTTHTPTTYYWEASSSYSLPSYLWIVPKSTSVTMVVPELIHA